MGALVGPTGCEGARGTRAPRPWLATLAAGGFDTTIGFDRDVDLQMVSAVVGVSRRFGSDLGARVGIGGIIDGTAELGDRTWDVRPGWLASAAVSYRYGVERFFVTGSAVFSVSRSSTREQGTSTDHSLTAFDLRLGAIAGVTLGERVSPYVLARVFGGPVLWHLDGEDVTGSDKNKFQIGAGLSARIAERFSILIDVSALGERAASLGIAAHL